MSIWNNYEIKPFYIFKMKSYIKGKTLYMKFIERHCPNENKLREIANKYAKLLGKLENIDKTSFTIKLNNIKLDRFIYYAQSMFKYDNKVNKITVNDWEYPNLD